VAQALAGPFLIAALTLCAAGVAKLRSPGPAADALTAARLPGSAIVIRGFAAGELALGVFAAVTAEAGAAAALAVVYTGFAVLVLILRRQEASCGCFGTTGAPASRSQAVISAVLALVSAAAAASGTHGVSWILGRSPVIAMTLVLGIGSAVFATVVAYSELPAAWKAWTAR
jgi:hypothetical protein